MTPKEFEHVVHKLDVARGAIDEVDRAMGKHDEEIHRAALGARAVLNLFEEAASRGLVDKTIGGDEKGGEL